MTHRIARAAGRSLSYSAYGVTLRSEVPFSRLVAGTRSPDVEIRIIRGDVSRESPKETHHELTADAAGLSWKGVGTIVVRQGKEVLVYPHPDVDVGVLQVLLLGPVMAVLLEQRGHLVLHASGVMLDDGAVAFLGASGWGKSTLAAALHARGHGIVADDIVPVTVGDTSVLVQPGYPQLRLLPQDASLFGHPLGAGPDAGPDKAAYPVVEGFPTFPQPLRRIYVLSEGTHPHIEDIDAQDTVIELIRHSYTARFLDSTRIASNFAQCAGIATMVPVRRLRSKHHLSALPEVAAIVERDVRCA